LNDPEVVQAFRKVGAVMMKADWTNRDPAITAYLQQHGRAGIPFYALYRPGQPALLLSEFLTKARMLEVLRS
jgi:thiol:disulfide interchange protein